MDKKRIGVLISGNGSNLQALIDACAHPEFPAEITVVISSKANAYGLNRARDAGIPAHIFEAKDFPARETMDCAIHAMLERHLVDVVCLAGYMRLLSDSFVRDWHNKMINIHPSLLPAFKGAHAVRDALAAGVKITGCTVHFVRPEVDAGPIILQAAVPVLADDNEETLAARLNEQEHRIYPQALRLLCEDKLVISGGRVTVTSE